MKTDNDNKGRASSHPDVSSEQNQRGSGYRSGQNYSGKPRVRSDRDNLGKPHSRSEQRAANESSGKPERNAAGKLHGRSDRDNLGKPHSRYAPNTAEILYDLTETELQTRDGETEFPEIRQYFLGEEKSEKLLSLLGFAARARRLVFGTELCRDAARAGQISLAIIAADASDNTKKRIVDACKYYGCDVCHTAILSSTLASRLGKSGITAVVGLGDHNFIRGITALCGN